jgi:hypothetical protein
MKTIRTATGIKRIEDCSDNIALIKIREILTDHRNTLINRLIVDLPTYASYRFNRKPDKDQINNIIDKLSSMKLLSVDLDKYDNVIQEILMHDSTHLNAEIFYREIDEVIYNELHPTQMVLVK